jgi:hypothetical protein
MTAGTSSLAIVFEETAVSNVAVEATEMGDTGALEALI